jgi:hypothetical protein
VGDGQTGSIATGPTNRGRYHLAGCSTNRQPTNYEPSYHFKDQRPKRGIDTEMPQPVRV